MSDAKRKALDAISALPEDTEPQEIINLLYRIYRLQRGLASKGAGPAQPAGLREHLARQLSRPAARTREDIDQQVATERDSWE